MMQQYVDVTLVQTRFFGSFSTLQVIAFLGREMNDLLSAQPWLELIVFDDAAAAAWIGLPTVGAARPPRATSRG
jgi:hypothetical protein